MQQIEPLDYSYYYHIYNRGINSCNLFIENANYKYFLSLYDKYISSIAHTFAWVLMPNHFHLLVKIKEEKELKLAETTPDRVRNPVGGKTQSPSHQFGKLFNSYAQAFNKKYSRHGSLFERPFKRKKIESETYLNQIIVYIHNNPVHHGFCNHPEKYSWSSYLTCLSDKPTKLNRREVIERFDCRKNFQYVHEESIDVEMIEQLLEL